MNRMRQLCPVLVFLLVLACGDARAAERLPLGVDIDGARLDTPVPVRSGIPFAQGKVKGRENVRLLRKGREIEFQERVLAAWPDGSVKWLLLDFVAKDGDRVTVEYGSDVKRATSRGGIRANKSDNVITVDTGVIRLTTRKNGTAFIDELAFDKNGNGKYDHDETVIRPPAPGEQRYFLDFLHRPANRTYEPLGNHMPGGDVGRSQVEIRELKLEEEGPLHCVILIRGKHKVRKLAGRIADQIRYEGQSEFTVRLHLYKGSGAVTAELHFVFDGVGDDDFVKAWGVRLNVGSKMRFLTWGNNDPVAVTPSRAAPFVALTQESADSYKIWSADEERFGETVHERGRRSSGWADIANDDWGVTVGIRRFWEKWPNAVHYDATRGEVSLLLYPPESALMDLRRYARHEFGVGETSAPDGDLTAWAPFASKGTANSKEIRLVFHRGNADPSRLDAEHRAFNVFPLAKASPAYYSQTRALGYWAPRVPGKWETYEDQFQSFLAKYIKGQRTFRWYGLWDYGDYQQQLGSSRETRSHRHGRWENDWGRWGWGQNDGHGRFGWTLLMQYLRTGERLYFEQGEAINRHVMDVDILESREIPWDYSVVRKVPPERTRGPWWDLRGCAHRHGVQHWSCPYVGARGASPLGQRVYYYLTGNGRAADILDLIAEMGLEYFGWGGYEKVSQRLGHSGGPDGQGCVTAALFVAWERTGDERYHRALQKLVHNKNSYETSFGGTQTLDEYADITGDSTAKQKLVDQAMRLMRDKKARKVWSWPQSPIHTIIAGYRLSGNKALGRLLRNKMMGKRLRANYAVEMSYAIEALNLRDVDKNAKPK